MLELLQAEAIKRKGWTQYAQYCACRINGDRQAALKHLQSFTTQAVRWELAKRKQFVVWLLSHLEPYPITSQCPALEEPFVSTFLRPTLMSWCDESEPADARPFRWLGMFFQGDDTKNHLAKAIEIDPAEQLARITLLGKIFEECFDGTASAGDRDMAKSLMAGIEDEPTRDYWMQLAGKRLI